MNYLLHKIGLSKPIKPDNSLAIVPAYYFSSLMLEIEMRGLKDTHKSLATFEYNNYDITVKENQINITDYEIDDNYNNYDKNNNKDDELSKGGVICLIFDQHLLKTYPEKVHLFTGGSGGYYSYYLGIGSILQEHFIFDNVIFSGVSGGNIINLLLALNINIREAFENWNVPLLNTISNFKLGALFNWNNTAKEYLVNRLPEDAYLQVKGRYHVYSTEFHFMSKWKNRVISEWDSNDELVKALMASCQIPILLGGNIYTYYRDEKFIDGCFSYKPELNHHIHLPSIKIYANTWRPYKLSWLWCWSSVEWHRKIFDWGQQDALKNLSYMKQFLMPK
jgi:hypothetical protein